MALASTFERLQYIMRLSNYHHNHMYDTFIIFYKAYASVALVIASIQPRKFYFLCKSSGCSYKKVYLVYDPILSG